MAEDESDQELEHLGKELGALLQPPRCSSLEYCRRFCEVVDDYTGQWQVPLPQLQILQTALCYFTSASALYPAECEHVQYVFSRLALSLFELLLFFGKDEFYEAPLKGIINSIQECSDLLQQNANMDLKLVTYIMKDGGPWENPVLQSILKGNDEPLNLVNQYLSSENPLFFELRARYLIACERTTEAVALITSCLSHPDLSKNLFYHQGYFTCLHMTPSTDGLLQEHVLRIDCKDGTEIICMTEKEGKTALALRLCEAFLLRQLHSGDMYHVWDLIFVWSKLQSKSNSSKELFVHRCYQLLRTATNIRVIFPFMKTIINEVGEDGVQLAVEICGCALQLDLCDDIYTKTLIYKTIAHLLPNDLEICRICVLSVFFLERSLDSYHAVERLYERPDEDYNEHRSTVENRVRFELLPILKRGLMFDPEFWNFSMIKQSCAALLRNKSARSTHVKTHRNSPCCSACPKEQHSLTCTKVQLTDRRNGGLVHRYVSLSRSRREALAKKHHVETYKVDHNVPRHRCMLCHKEFLGGHIMRHAHAHEKKGFFTCVICGRTFRKRTIMVTHLKNHIQKLKQMKLAAVGCAKETVIREEPKLCESLQDENKNVNMLVSNDCLLKDNETGDVLHSVVDGSEHSTEHSVAMPLDQVSEQNAAIENSNPSPCLNALNEPLIADGVSKEEENLKTDCPFLHKINGSFCSPMQKDSTALVTKLKCPSEGCARVFKRMGSFSKHVRITHPADLSAQQEMGSLIEAHSLNKHARFKCPGPGCIRVFKRMDSLSKHIILSHSHDVDVQQMLCFLNVGKSVNEPVNSKCPGQRCIRTLNRIASLKSHQDGFVEQLQLPSPVECDITSLDKPVIFPCPSRGCSRVFRNVAALINHTKKVHRDNLDLQQLVPLPTVSDAVADRGTLQCPGQGCMRLFKKMANLIKHTKQVHVDHLDLLQKLTSSRESDAVVKPDHFQCPGPECYSLFKNVNALTKHAITAHHSDLKVQQHIMTCNKGKCNFCQRSFVNVQHFLDHLKRHVAPNVFFCLHVNCDQRFKLASDLFAHSLGHKPFKPTCCYPGCSEMFGALPSLYEHEAQHYITRSLETCTDMSNSLSLDSVPLISALSTKPQTCFELSQQPTTNCTELLSVSQDQAFLRNEIERLDLSTPTWKSRKDCFQPKTYNSNAEKKSFLNQNVTESPSGDSSLASLVDHMSSILTPVCEPSNEVNGLLTNGHKALEQTASISINACPEKNTFTANLEKCPVLQSEGEQLNTSGVSRTSLKSAVLHQTPPYGGPTTKPFSRPLPSAYLDEMYTSMPKRRKASSDNSKTKDVQSPVSERPAERLRCTNCFTICCDSEALEAHLAQKKCRSLFGFDSDEESAW